MYFLLSAILTGVLGYFVPQWMFEMTWTDLISIKNGETLSSQLSQLVRELGWTSQSAAELAQERIRISILMTLAIFIALIIITGIIKKAVNKK